MRRTVVSAIAVFLVSAVFSAAETRAMRILHVMSYNAEWQWNKDQFDGFKHALAGTDVQYRIIEIDAKRRGSAAWFDQVSREADAVIADWKPDLIYANDDDAQELVTKRYVGSAIPIVFSAVNAAPELYGFDKAPNVAGVLEVEHFDETVRLLKAIVPSLRTLAVVVDESPMWIPVIDRIKRSGTSGEGVKVARFDTIGTFDEYKAKMRDYVGRVDGVALLGVFQFKDPAGNFVPYAEVLKWTVENSPLPDCSCWEDRITYGTLCAVTVSGYEQGYAAGKIARGILVEGKKPSSFPISPTTKGEPVVSLARAKTLGLALTSDVLLSSKVYVSYAWEESR